MMERLASISATGMARCNLPPLVTLPAGSFPQAIALADLDGDGKLDLVEADYNNTSLASGAVRVIVR